MSFPKRNRGKAIQTPWLSEIPEEWETKPIKVALTPVSRPVGDSWSDTTLLSLTQSGIIPRDIESAKGKFPTDFSSYQHVKPDDLIFCLFDIDETPRAVGLSKLDGMVTGAYSVFEANKGNSPDYLSYFFHWIDDGKLLRPYYTGLRKVVRPQTFGAINIPLPPFSEQRQIANFLDRETAKIDALIAEQQRLIELLQEKQQAVISHAVTKGLNPNAPMKDSGVEWLGEVPEHWAVCAVGYRYEVRLGKMLDEKKVTGQHLGPYLRNTDVQWEAVNTEDLPEMDFDPSEHERYSLKEGDLLVCEGGEVGRSAIWESSLPVCFYQKALHRLRPLNASQDTPRFQLYIMKMACSKGVFEASSGKATINHLPAEAFRRYRFAYPPFIEQQAISEHLSTACGEIRRLQQEASSLVSILQERRSALISAAVTGQIDVRELMTEAVGQ